jgi:hypothetical protein
MTLKSDVWDIRPLPKEVENLSPVKKQRFVKINPHLFLKDYELSIWVDGNVSLNGNLNDFLDTKITDDEITVYVPKHPDRKCIYEEAEAVVRMRKDTADNVNKQMNRYKSEGFPKEQGLLQSNILVRQHNNPDCIKLMEAWSDEVMNGSHRDQLSFNYAAWKNQDVKVGYLQKNICKSQWFDWRAIHIKKHTAIKRKKPNTLTSHISTIKAKRQRNKDMFNALIASRKAMNNAMYDSFNQY